MTDYWVNAVIAGADVDICFWRACASAAVTLALPVDRVAQPGDFGVSERLVWPCALSKQKEQEMNPSNPKTGLGAMLTPDNCVFILIDQQPYQFAGLRSHDTQTIINDVVGLAKSAKVYKVPTLLTTVVEERGGFLLKELQDVFPDQKPINRTFINTWEDKRVVDWVKKTGRKKIVMAALWTEICMAVYCKIA